MKAKACPFCGDNGEPVVVGTQGLQACQCPNCEARGPIAGLVSEAKKAWQQRKGEKKLLQGIIDEIEGAAPACEAHKEQLKKQAALLKTWLRRV